MVDAINTMNDLSFELIKTIDDLKEQGIKHAHAERLYKMCLREQSLILKESDMAVTLIDKVVYGVPSVADKRLERDIADVMYKVAQEKINVLKLQMRVLDNQISREWGKSE